MCIVSILVGKCSLLQVVFILLMKTSHPSQHLFHTMVAVSISMFKISPLQCHNTELVQLYPDSIMESHVFQLEFS